MSKVKLDSEGINIEEDNIVIKQPFTDSQEKRIREIVREELHQSNEIALLNVKISSLRADIES